MPQIENGIRSFLKQSHIYNIFQYLIGGPNARRRFIEEYVRPQPNMCVLDIGCGTGAALNYLPRSVVYYGVDINQNYIDQAVKKFGERGVFLCNDLNDDNFINSLPKFDLVLGMGILHHLDDAVVLKLVHKVRKSMHPHARLITFDGCYVPNQSRIARYMLKQDRGQNVRQVEEYRHLVSQVFPKVEISVCHDLLRIPYTIAIMDCAFS